MKGISRTTPCKPKPYSLITFFFSSLTVAMVAIGFPHGSQSHRLNAPYQKPEKTLKQRKWSNEPIKIVGVKARGKTIPLDEKIIGDDDWFHRLTIKVKNISDKNIVFIELELHFLRTKSSAEPLVAFPLISGPLNEQPQRILNPGDSWELSLSDEDYDLLVKKLRMSDYPVGVGDIEIITREVILADNTRWIAGQSQPRTEPDKIKRKPNQSKHRPLDSFKSPSHVPLPLIHVNYQRGFSFLGKVRQRLLRKT